jgi:ARG and Rhodanese-Phosphatase-superfamily-associated Protein domain
MEGKRGTICSVAIVAGLIGLAVAMAAARLHPTVQASAGGREPGRSDWQLASPINYQNLTIFPVVSSESADTTDFVTLDEALASGDVQITEQGDSFGRTRDGRVPSLFSSGPQVNQLVLVNRGKRPVLLLAGEVVTGGKQDRIIGKDRIVPVGRTPLPLDVFCVEHGRWTGASNQFSQTNLMVHPSVREEAAIEQDQRQVWAAVRGEEKSVAAGAGVGLPATAPRISTEALSEAIAAAGTQSYQKIYRLSPIGTSVGNETDEVRRRFDRATSDLKGRHVIGVVVAFGDEVAWSDIFVSTELFNAYWPKLLSSYVVEAMTRPGMRQVASLEDARDFLRPITGHIEEESEPGVYVWRKQSLGRLSETQLTALMPRALLLHDLRILRGDERGFTVR